MHTSSGSLLAALAAAAVISAVAAGPAAADTANPGGRSIVHHTPKVPLVVDGVRHAPADIHRFDGQPLYLAAAADGKKLFAFTKRNSYAAYLKRTAGVRLKPGTLEPQTSPASARASDAGDYAKFCYLRNLGNPCFTVPSGWGVVDLAAVPLGTLPGTFDNNIESVYTNKRMVALYDYYFEGDPLFLRSNGPKFWNLADWGYANRATSVWAGWAN